VVQATVLEPQQPLLLTDADGFDPVVDPFRAARAVDWDQVIEALHR
jgi:hypothetical protein